MKNETKMTKKITALLSICASLLLISPAFASYGGTTIYPVNGVYTIDAEAGDTIILEGTGDILTEIQITLTDDVTTTCTASVSTTKPDAAPTGPDLGIYAYFDIGCAALNDAMTSASIRFSVSKSWLSSNGVSKNDLKLYHYVDGSWTALTTQLVSETSTVVNYAATTTSFSYFSVAGPASTTAPTGENLFIYLGLGAGLLIGGVVLLVPKSTFLKKKA